MARILGNKYNFYGSKIEYKKNSSQPSMIAMLVNSGSMSLKKRTRGRRPMNGNASTVEPPDKESNEVKAGEASFKIYQVE